MRKTLLAGAAALLISGAFAAGAFADTKAGAGPEAREAKMQSFCTDRAAHVSGHLAYLEAKLKPTAAQQAAWKAYADAVTTAAAQHEKDCLARPARHEGRPSIVERNAMMEKALEAKLASLKATTPALTALYATLSDTQKAVLDRDHRGGRRHFAEWRGHDRHDGMMHKARFEHRGDGMQAPDMPAPDAPAEQ